MSGIRDGACPSRFLVSDSGGRGPRSSHWTSSSRPSSFIFWQFFLHDFQRKCLRYGESCLFLCCCRPVTDWFRFRVLPHHSLDSFFFFLFFFFGFSSFFFFFFSLVPHLAPSNVCANGQDTLGGYETPYPAVNKRFLLNGGLGLSEHVRFTPTWGSRQGNRSSDGA